MITSTDIPTSVPGNTESSCFGIFNDGREISAFSSAKIRGIQK